MFATMQAWRTGLVAIRKPVGAGAEVLSDPCQAIAPQPQTLSGARSFTYRQASGRDLRVHVLAPESEQGGASRPAILFFFGGAWRVGDINAFRAQADACVARGYVAVLADYRVKCRDGTSPLDAVRDAHAAHTWLRAEAHGLGVDPARIVLSGGSAGGHLALTTAMKSARAHRPAALVLFNPAVDLVGPAPLALKLVARRISPSVLPVAGLPPTLVFHGQDDQVVPVHTVEAFCARAIRAGRLCQLQTYAGHGHGFFHGQQDDAALGRSPFADTLQRMWRFLDAQGLTPAG